MSDDDGDNGEKDSKDEGGTILDDGGIDTDERAGRSLGIEPNKEPDDETKKDMEEERKRRLDPDNRPEGAEVDNTEREFDVDRGQFKDSDDYDESEPPPFSDPEDPNKSEDDDSSGSSDPKDDAGEDTGDEAGDKADDSEDTDDSEDDKES